VAHTIIHHSNNGHYLAKASQATTLNALPKTIWDKISNIIGLTEWVIDVKKTEFLSKTKRGIGTIRKITFLDQSQVIEYVVGWKPENYLSYIATSGLPLDAYHATLSILPKGKTSQLTWASFLISNSTDKKKFEEFLSFIDGFYEKSLQNLKAKIEKAT
jgi:hypothetical protein